MPILYPDGREAKTLAEMREAIPSIPANECFGCYLGDCDPALHDVPDDCQYLGGVVYHLEDHPDADRPPGTSGSWGEGVMAGFATCEACQREMNPGVGCVPTHVGRGENGPWVKRIVVGGGNDWGGPQCPDCNAGAGMPHHEGCDVERCPGCGLQMWGCDCEWQYMATIADPAREHNAHYEEV